VSDEGGCRYSAILGTVVTEVIGPKDTSSGEWPPDPDGLIWPVRPDLIYPPRVSAGTRWP